MSFLTRSRTGCLVKKFPEGRVGVEKYKQSVRGEMHEQSKSTGNAGMNSGNVLLIYQGS